MLVWLEPQTGRPSVVEVGAKPPSNQPQVTCWRFSRSPMFSPVSATREPSVVWLVSEQSS